MGQNIWKDGIIGLMVGDDLGFLLNFPAEKIVSMIL